MTMEFMGKTILGITAAVAALIIMAAIHQANTTKPAMAVTDSAAKFRTRFGNPCTFADWKRQISGIKPGEEACLSPIEQEDAARRQKDLPATGECISNDMRVVDCSARDATMSMENFKSKMKSLCNSLDNRKISEMTSKELRIQGACRAVTAGHFFDY
jgi:hypothetical protein